MRKTILSAFAALTLGGQTQAGDPTLIWPKNSQFTCTGVLTAKEGELRLDPDKGMLAWCWALFDGPEGYGVTKFDAAKRVKATCSVGDRCQVKGTIQGHGEFFWTKIISVKKLP